MKIVQRCDYRFPARGSAGAERLVESLTRGLLELGHEVVLWCKPGSALDYVKCVDALPEGFDIIHHHGWHYPNEKEYDSWGTPWVSTLHGGGMENGADFMKAANNNPHLVCVSKFVADRVKCRAFVHSCSDPSDFIFKKEKQDYFLYLAGLDWGFDKGLDTFIKLSKLFPNYRFIIAGAGRNQQIVDFVKNVCSQVRNLKFVGEVNGVAKAELIANAKAYVLPTKLPDACPMTVSEALLSGTPVIGSSNGSMPELLHPSVGFSCKQDSDYVKAFVKINEIDPETCRKYAMENFSSAAAAKKYVELYEKMLKYNTVQA